MGGCTDPKNSDVVEGAVGRSVRLNHTEHAVELPVDEENDKKVVRIPKPLEVSTTPLLDRKEYHNEEGGSHDPPSHARTCKEIGSEE